MADFAQRLALYHPEHAARLSRRRRGADWRAAVDAGLVARARARRVPPGATPDFVATVVDQLLAHNQAAVRARVAAGETDRALLVEALGRWPDDLGGTDPRLGFLGLTLTYGCNFDPRCGYCTQQWHQPALDLAAWKRVVADATDANQGAGGPYVYLTGGEALTLEEDVWGDDGLVAFASRRGAAVNLNTNAALITPAVALRLLQAGVAKVHVSLDTPHAATQDALWGGPGRLARVLQGLDDLQVARDLVGVDGPEIHVNCVVTRHNLDAVGDLWSFLLRRKQRVPKGHPLFHDLLPHLIPVGGDAGGDLRPDAAGFARLYGPLWSSVAAAWDAYQTELGLPPGERGPLLGPFRNPFERVEHTGDLAAYARASAAGHYGDLALARACYVAPTQASVTPDGLQFRCGAHAVRRLQAVGRLDAGAGLLDNIRAARAGLPDLPRPEVCHSCALATIYINQTVERRLGQRLDAWLQEADGCTS